MRCEIFGTARRISLKRFSPAINPLGQTPALLTHAGTSLLERMAILLHLNSVLSFLHTTFHAAFMPALQASRAAVWREMAVDKVNKSLAHVVRVLAALETDPGIRFAHAIEAGLPATGQGGFLGHVALDQLASQAG